MKKPAQEDPSEVSAAQSLLGLLTAVNSDASTRSDITPVRAQIEALPAAARQLAQRDTDAVRSLPHCNPDGSTQEILADVERYVRQITGNVFVTIGDDAIQLATVETAHGRLLVSRLGAVILDKIGTYIAAARARRERVAGEIADERQAFADAMNNLIFNRAANLWVSVDSSELRNSSVAAELWNILRAVAQLTGVDRGSTRFHDSPQHFRELLAEWNSAAKAA